MGRQDACVYRCDVAVIGGGVGGVAAALAAAEAGAVVVLTETTDWLGGQMTNQGVSALDEHAYIETFGGTRNYYRLREAIRAYYHENYGAPAIMPNGMPLNPGNGWVSRLCFEPRAAVQAIDALLAPHTESKCLTVLRQHTPTAARVVDDRVIEIGLSAPQAARAAIQAGYFLDATELGDVLPLTGAAYTVGAESQADTGEPHASPDGPHPDRGQSFTFCFAVEYCPNENHTIAPPRDYARFRDEQPYSFTLMGHDGVPKHFKMFEAGSPGTLPFWTYRRIFDSKLLEPARRDITLINWSGNDYYGANLIDKLPHQQAFALDEAKRLALGFLYWLQTEAPRDEGGYGYPELKLLPDVMGTPDGLSKLPYIREARRILPLTRIVENDIASAGRQGARAAPFDDTVGIGWYNLDLHACVGDPECSLFVPTLPFQIPLGALIPPRPGNLLAAAKNIGTTHITNGAYRVHPVEWAIGEAAGALAAFCCRTGRAPRQVRDTEALLRAFQYRLVNQGIPLAWAVDVPATDPCFGETQLLLLAGALSPDSARFHTLEIRPDTALNAGEINGVLSGAGRLLGKPVPADLPPPVPLEWRAVCARLKPEFARVLSV